MGDFDLFTNPHVRNYFELKRSGDHYKKALAELQIACDQGDGQAWFIMGRVQKDFNCIIRSAELGCPWGMYECKQEAEAIKTGDDYVLALYHHNRDDISIAYMRSACRQNNIFAIEDILTKDYYLDDAEYDQWLNLGVKLGIPQCYILMAEEEENKEGLDKIVFEWYLKGSLQHHPLSMGCLANCYWYGSGCTLDKIKAIELVFEADARLEIYSWLRDTIDTKLLFVFGRELTKHKSAIFGSNLLIENAIRIYQEDIERTRKSIVYFLLCTRRFLIKDVRQMIAKYIWRLRNDP